ncbi:penicillin-binding protein activator [Ancylobacter sp. 6x-1]|uniref:Penicillin-binding protein activator n=1 Tax=Ancylobacter crimeensis TaxID=2579147 RepID=A0ABT0DBX9_9HYPH|nr:penicillin-binding protein activator [Ancylobacter crimeensis]MCK0197467.1 penicillin-binding protein activator [Ancylobacter crimeensis]
MLLAACGSTIDNPPPQAGFSPAPAAAPVAPQPQPSNGGVRVALLLPLSASGNAAAAAQSLRNAAQLALDEVKGGGLDLVVKDDGGNAQGAQAAAQQAIDEGARAIIGPLFAPSVASAGQVARSRGVPVIGFSTDTNVATQGVYLLSFLPQSDVQRVVRFAASRGRRSFAALIPANAYGSVVEAAFREVVPTAGGRVVGLEKYTSGNAASYADAARRLAPSAAQADAIFIPDAGDAVPQVLAALQSAGVSLAGKQLMGTGLWDNARLAANPAVAGGIFAAPDPAGYRAFAERYRARFGSAPVRTASLAHDAVSLLAVIVGSQGPMGINDTAIQSPSGYTGVDGIFRFMSDGTNQRGLAVLQFANGTSKIVDPAPTSFAGGGF